MQPFTLLIKPSGSDCNIDCRYCFYKGRAVEFGQGRQRMSDAVLEKMVRDYLGLGLSVSGFAWQGGEPTLMGVDFFRTAVELQKRHGKAGQQISNTMQTNATLLEDDWCRFLHENKFLLGISIDGPREFHDAYRVDHAGQGTFHRVFRGIQNCKKHNVEFSALILLNSLNVGHPDRLFAFLVENDLTFVQFIPCVEIDPATGAPAEFSITPQQYGDFLCRLFDLWIAHGPQKMNIREFDSLVTYYVLGHHTICTYSKQCAGFVVVEHSGDAFCCEFFVEPKWRLGSILETPLDELAASGLKKAFARDKERLDSQCLACRHLAICRGGCIKDRVRGATPGKSYFCESYRQFFDHTIPRFMQIAAAVKTGALARHTRAAQKIRLQIE
ncbi:MAG: anaerobic sulfatase maturase [Planctomycetes bacterium RBG_13_62_9]|nr:MAG: anaerobic sulfatase maturase [Planctomycetes bacterium RBG_13_62_9]